ncbi:MAG: selenocysteine-specific translation elongation factor [Thermodesulfobacteriota bacterium]
MKQIVLGTAGHIDHGKTSLIRALTGVDTDRLKEEKLRGITIELGFASFVLPGGQRIGIVDVPGHEKFVRNMVAGATGIDVVALVIAADEGVMPQTREHLDICSILRVRQGLVVLTKTDMVDPEWLELVTEDVREFVAGTFLAEAPIVPVSSVTGEGLDRLTRTLEEICREVSEPAALSLFRLPVDRVFTMRGFGTVVTGTLTSGKVAVGDSVEIYPTGVKSKVRGLQVHNQSVNEALAGQRTAINFQGLEKEAIERGQVVAYPGSLKPGYMVDVELSLLTTTPRPLKNNARVRFHTGTSEVMAKVVLLDRDELLPGEGAVVQMRLETPVALVRNDRFVIRAYSPVATIGGGGVVSPIARKHKRMRKDVSENLARLASASPEELAALAVLASEYAGASFAELLIMTNLPEKRLEKILADHLSKKTLITVDKETRTYLHARTLAGLMDRAEAEIKAFHEANPIKAGMPKEELKSRIAPFLAAKAFFLLLESLQKENRVLVDQDSVRLAGHSVSLGREQADLTGRVEKDYAASGLTPPTVKELCEKFSAEPKAVKEVLGHLVEKKSLVKVKEDLYFDAAAMAALKERLVAYLREHGEITTPEFKDMTGASRKFVIPLLEWFDSGRVTLRVGDARKLRSGV